MNGLSNPPYFELKECRKTLGRPHLSHDAWLGGSDVPAFDKRARM